MVIDALPGVTPLVENIDNFMKNRRLCSVVETRYGQGRLILSSMDLLTDTDNRPAARQLLYSLLNYMNTDRFNPQGMTDEKQLEQLQKR